MNSTVFWCLCRYYFFSLECSNFQYLHIPTNIPHKKASQVLPFYIKPSLNSPNLRKSSQRNFRSSISHDNFKPWKELGFLRRTFASLNRWITWSFMFYQDHPCNFFENRQQKHGQRGKEETGCYCDDVEADGGVCPVSENILMIQSRNLHFKPFLILTHGLIS